MAYHGITEVWKNRLACFHLDRNTPNICSVPPLIAEMFSFAVVEQGCADYMFNYKKFSVEKGDMLLFSPSMLVSLTRCSPDFRCINLMCERRLFEHMLSTDSSYGTYSYFFCSNDVPVIHLTPEQLSGTVECMSHIRSNIIGDHSYVDGILNHLMHAFLLTVLEIIERRRSQPHTVNRCEAIFHNFIALLADNYRQQHFIGYYAGRLSITPTYLSRTIRRQTDKTAGYFINGMLYAEALRLLEHTDHSIQQIAEKLCFSDQSAFGKFFKSKAGVSPQQFRSRNKY